MLSALEKFALYILLESREGTIGDVDGGTIQDIAQALGLLVEVRVAEPCGENCNCAEYDDFPQNCLRYSDDVRLMIEEMDAEKAKAKDVQGR